MLDLVKHGGSCIVSPLLQYIPAKRRNHLKDAALAGRVIVDKPRCSPLDPLKLIEVA